MLVVERIADFYKGKRIIVRFWTRKPCLEASFMLNTFIMRLPWHFYSSPLKISFAFETRDATWRGLIERSLPTVIFVGTGICLESSSIDFRHLLSCELNFCSSYSVQSDSFCASLCFCMENFFLWKYAKFRFLNKLWNRISFFSIDSFALIIIFLSFSLLHPVAAETFQQADP